MIIVPVEHPGQVANTYVTSRTYVTDVILRSTSKVSYSIVVEVYMSAGQTLMV